MRISIVFGLFSVPFSVSIRVSYLLITIHNRISVLRRGFTVYPFTNGTRHYLTKLYLGPSVNELRKKCLTLIAHSLPDMHGKQLSSYFLFLIRCPATKPVSIVYRADHANRNARAIPLFPDKRGDSLVPGSFYG